MAAEAGSSAPVESNTTEKPTPHGSIPRGLPRTPASSVRNGRFGRMFRHVPVFDHDSRTLDALARTMIQEREEDKPLNAKDRDQNDATLGGELRLPAGYTYFGQFVDHDITFDPASSLTRQNDPDALTNFRTPAFDLDSLYGRGPDDQPYLYDSDGVKLLLGEGDFDLQRNERGRALIGDPRNDENLVVSQLQVTFVRFHNAVVEHVSGTSPDLHRGDLFKVAQQTVRWHYQWVVIHDFLRRLVGQPVIDDILKEETYAIPGGDQKAISSKLRFYDWKEKPFMPLEFSVAAYRFGHSMARPSYLVNDHAVPITEGAIRIPLFGPGRGARSASRANGLADLRGFQPIPRHAVVDWKYFLPIEHANWPNDDFLPQPSYRIDTELSNPLGHLPDVIAGPQALFQGANPAEAQSLAARNLFRAQALGLPSGQDVARAMGIEPLKDTLLDGLPLDTDERADLAGHWPLWFYILKEADTLADGAHLGPVGGRIVAEVLIGLACGDPLSYLGVSPGWKPTLSENGTFTLTDLVRFAGRA